MTLSDDKLSFVTGEKQETKWCLISAQPPLTVLAFEGIFLRLGEVDRATADSVPTKAGILEARAYSSLFLTVQLVEAKGTKFTRDRMENTVDDTCSTQCHTPKVKAPPLGCLNFQFCKDRLAARLLISH